MSAPASRAYDVIVIGAGSIGVPAAMTLGERGLRTLVLESLPSPGQGQNKKAIGGIRATHSDRCKIKVCQRSIEIFTSWRDRHGDDLGWNPNGYTFPAYSDQDADKLRKLVELQRGFGLNIRWVSPEDYGELVPGIQPDELRGSTYSPDDGSASPLLAINAFYFRSLALGVDYRFNEQVTAITPLDGGRSFEIVTDKGRYSSARVVNAAGNFGADIGRLAGDNVPVIPDSHEAGISEPVERFFKPMIVDMRPLGASSNFYFYQNFEGQILFCLTPKPLIPGMDSDSTSVFLPLAARRMVSVYPRLANLKVRRTWRGQYPMSPDGFPLVGASRRWPGFIHAVGMCGQGFMLGPGLGELIAGLVMGSLSEEESETLTGFNPERDFTGQEQFK